MEPDNRTDEPALLFPVVGLGASAGGLEALTAFFEALPVNSGMAFVVVQHLSPNQASILHEIIQRHTKINVQRIVDNTVVETNQIYVMPEAHEVTIRQNRLYLNAVADNHGWPDAINHFFQSLALDCQERAVAIILSGAGHDGTDGAQAIKHYKGLVIAQDLETTTQSSMPFNVIDAGLATVVLAPDLMPRYLLSHFGIDVPLERPFEDMVDTITAEDLKQVIKQLRRQTRYDFTDYKVSTLRRQIARRMGAFQLDSVSDYLRMMEKQSGEASQLVKGLLVHVTSFFRDPDAFEALKISAILPLLKTLSVDDVLRVWIPGCASGEEAVSIAILIHECLYELKMQKMEVRVFATDVNHDLVQFGRAGTYPLSIADSMSETRLKENFLKTQDTYQVRTHISRMIVWAEHNLTEHPPFSNLHMISCRNVMIYFQARLQQRTRALFQFALRAGGILFMGLSEAMPDETDLFTVIDSKQKIYKRSTTSSRSWMRLDQPLFAKVLSLADEQPVTSKTLLRRQEDASLQVIKDMLLEHYNSTCIIVDSGYHMRYTYGDVDRYFRLVAGGDTRSNMINMAREGLDAELTIALYEAFESHETVVRYGVAVKVRGDEHVINIIVKSIQDLNGVDHLLKLVIFENHTSRDGLHDSMTDAVVGEDVIVPQWREELQRLRKALQTATQALQAKSEELASSIEEITSANEEIQTTNEELRTSKEELESMNEELNTVNTQLSNQNHELTHANNSLYNFLQSTAIAVIFLDQNLAIREYTQVATTIFSLRRSDIGRPLVEITSQLTPDTLIADAMHVLDSLINSEQEVLSGNGHWYKVDIRPYRTMNNVIDGLVLTFSNITAQKQALHIAEQMTVYVRKMMDTLDDCLLELDGELRVVAVNQAFYQQFGTKPADTIGTLLYDLGNGQWNIPDLRRLLHDIIPQQTVVRDYLFDYDFPSGKRTLHVNANQIKEVNRILLVIRDTLEKA